MLRNTNVDRKDDITFIDNVEILEKLSDFHNYCHGRQQQTDILHREVRENAIELQNAMVDLDNIIPDMPMAMDSSIFLLRMTHMKKTLTLQLTIPPKQLMKTQIIN
ncbi:hypothetical protein LOD99_9110 [Oopsacas minuta]|uniref:Uncharacterized protein n=1 Tax=Oopsacas minuta TaxID=111878 RepID=A0AAV7JDP2_9METZ|nr:hypothetical protein LOD99_9110 [Oopsacas minuta]